jgi:hypothetical protein
MASAGMTCPPVPPPARIARIECIMRNIDHSIIRKSSQLRETV